MRVTVRIPDDVARKAATLAQDKGVSVLSLYAEVIEAYVEEEHRKQAFERISRLIGTSVAPDWREQLDEIRKDRDLVVRDE